MNFFPYRGQFHCASQGLCLQPCVESVVSSLDQVRRLPCLQWGLSGWLRVGATVVILSAWLSPPSNNPHPRHTLVLAWQRGLLLGIW